MKLLAGHGQYRTETLIRQDAVVRCAVYVTRLSLYIGRDFEMFMTSVNQSISSFK